MNITNPDESLDAWKAERDAVSNNPDIPPEEKERLLHEIDECHAQIHDAVTAYVEARFMRVQ